MNVREQSGWSALVHAQDRKHIATGNDGMVKMLSGWPTVPTADELAIEEKLECIIGGDSDLGVGKNRTARVGDSSLYGSGKFLRKNGRNADEHRNHQD